MLLTRGVLNRRLPKRMVNKFVLLSSVQELNRHACVLKTNPLAYQRILIMVYNPYKL